MELSMQSVTSKCSGHEMHGNVFCTLDRNNVSWLVFFVLILIIWFNHQIWTEIVDIFLMSYELKKIIDYAHICQKTFPVPSRKTNWDKFGVLDISYPYNFQISISWNAEYVSKCTTAEWIQENTWVNII